MVIALISVKSKMSSVEERNGGNTKTASINVHISHNAATSAPY